MYPNALSLVLATSFTAGRMIIHSRRDEADHVAVVLILMLIGLMNLLSASLASRTSNPVESVSVAKMTNHRLRSDWRTAQIVLDQGSRSCSAQDDLASILGPPRHSAEVRPSQARHAP